jgi:hypothetical protein
MNKNRRPISSTCCDSRPKRRYRGERKRKRRQRMRSSRRRKRRMRISLGSQKKTKIRKNYRPDRKEIRLRWWSSSPARKTPTNNSIQWTSSKTKEHPVTMSKKWAGSKRNTLSKT